MPFPTHAVNPNTLVKTPGCFGWMPECTSYYLYKYSSVPSLFRRAALALMRAPTRVCTQGRPLDGVDMWPTLSGAAPATGPRRTLLLEADPHYCCQLEHAQYCQYKRVECWGWGGGAGLWHV